MAIEARVSLLDAVRCNAAPLDLQTRAHHIQLAAEITPQRNMQMVAANVLNDLFHTHNLVTAKQKHELELDQLEDWMIAGAFKAIAGIGRLTRG